MRHGRKSSQTRFDGYKLSASATNTSEPLITAVHIAAAGETDGPQAKHLIDSQPPERRPVRALGDTAYGNGPVRAELAERGVDVLAPVPAGKVEDGVLGKQDFAIDLITSTVTCPGGHAVTLGELCGLSTAEGPGEPVRHRYNRGGNRRVNRTLHQWPSPSCAASRVPKRSTRARASGHPKKEARRILKRHLSYVVYRRMIRDLALRTADHPLLAA